MSPAILRMVDMLIYCISGFDGSTFSPGANGDAIVIEAGAVVITKLHLCTNQRAVVAIIRHLTANHKAEIRKIHLCTNPKAVDTIIYTLTTKHRAYATSNQSSKKSSDQYQFGYREH